VDGATPGDVVVHKLHRDDRVLMEVHGDLLRR
jgi:hypothetical protein